MTKKQNNTENLKSQIRELQEQLAYLTDQKNKQDQLSLIEEEKKFFRKTWFYIPQSIRELEIEEYNLKWELDNRRKELSKLSEIIEKDSKDLKQFLKIKQDILKRHK